MKRLGIMVCLMFVGVALAQPAATATGAAGTAARLVPWLTIQVKDFGRISVELFPDVAPLNVRNVETLAAKGFYNGLTFHRIVPGFVIQGGDPTGTGAGGPEYTVPAEIKLKHVRGGFAMARTNNPAKASSSCQFYINLQDLPMLDGNYTVIGQTREGMDVVDAIAKVQRDENDKPLTPVVMEKVTVEMKPPTPAAPPAPRFSGDIHLTIDVQGYPTINGVLDPKAAPNNVASIFDFARSGMYDSTTLRLAKPKFVLQFGDLRSEKGGCAGGGCGGCGAVAAEPGRKHTRGAIGVGVASRMKRPETACEFYICLADQPGLDSLGYTVIGQVDDASLKVLDQIAKVKVDKDGKPLKAVLITKVTAQEVKPGQE